MIQTTELHKFSPVIIIFIGLVVYGCNEPFQPLAENDQVHFSIYGALDATADTQTVRVTPVRNSTISTPDPVEATVTLEHLGSDQKAVLWDSLYTYPGYGYARNYLTDMDLEPEESYRLVAEHADGEMSEATVTLPKNFPEPDYNLVCNDSPQILNSIELFIEGTDNLVAVTTSYYYKDLNSANPSKSKLTVQQYDEVRERPEGNYYLRVNVRENLITLLGINGSISHIQVDNISIFIANAGLDWPDVEGLSFDEQVLPEVTNNVENGTGFLGGIVSKTITVEPRCN